MFSGISDIFCVNLRHSGQSQNDCRVRRGRLGAAGARRRRRIPTRRAKLRSWSVRRFAPRGREAEGDQAEGGGGVEDPEDD